MRTKDAGKPETTDVVLPVLLYSLQALAKWKISRLGGVTCQRLGALIVPLTEIGLELLKLVNLPFCARHSLPRNAQATLRKLGGWRSKICIYMQAVSQLALMLVPARSEQTCITCCMALFPFRFAVLG